MTNPNFVDEEDEKPLDPTMEKVRRKMVRLLFISSSAIVLALMAVIGAIVYKSTRNSAAPTVPEMVEKAIAPEQTITLPAGFRIVSTTLSGNRILLHGTRADGSEAIRIHDLATGKTLADIEIRSE